LDDYRHLHRFFVGADSIVGGEVTVVGSAARQIAKVLRLGSGDRIGVLDGSGVVHIVRLSTVAEDMVNGDIVATETVETEPRVSLTVAAALTKGDRMEFALQKCTELGACEFIIFSSKRTVVKPDARSVERRLERWRSIVKEAAEQSSRAVVPSVRGIVSAEELAGVISGYDLAICLWEEETSRKIKSIISQKREFRSILIIVGPEGGFEENEVRMFEKVGAVSATLGPRVLRSETAAVAAVAIILNELG